MTTWNRRAYQTAVAESGKPWLTRAVLAALSERANSAGVALASHLEIAADVGVHRLDLEEADGPLDDLDGYATARHVGGDCFAYRLTRR